MKVITYLYRNIPTSQQLVMDSTEGASILLNDIIEARELNKKTLLIKVANGYRMIDPTEIVELSIVDIDTIGEFQ